jgi:hypothetical protein
VEEGAPEKCKGECKEEERQRKSESQSENQKHRDWTATECVNLKMWRAQDRTSEANLNSFTGKRDCGLYMT